MNKANPILRVLAAVVGAVIGYMAVNSLFGHASLEQLLVKTADEMNKKSPMMVDSETRWDKTIAGPGRKLTYIYTLINLDKADLDPAVLEKTLRAQITANYKTNEKMKRFREGNVELDYQYNDKHGAAIVEISVSPKDFGP